MGRVSRRWSAGDGVLGSPGRGSDYSQGQRQILSRDEDQSVRRQAGRQIVQRLLLPDSVRPPPAIAQPQHWSLFTRHNGPLFRRHRHWMATLEGADTDHPQMGKPEPLLQTPLNEGQPAISPDGEWVAYQTNEAGGGDIFVRHFP